MTARKSPAVCVAIALLFFAVAVPGSAQAGFGVKSVTATAINRDGSIDLQAGSHPFEYTLGFVLNQDAGGLPEGSLREVVVDLPPGLVGNTLATPRCTGADFEGVLPRCPGNTQIGVALAKTFGIPTATVPVYNLVPPLGVPLSIGFSLVNLNSFQEASLRTGEDYGGRVSDITIPTNLPIQSVTETIWGVPANADHDGERVCLNAEGLPSIHDCPSGVTAAPFLSLPTSCTGPLTTTVSVESVENPNVLVPKSVPSVNEAGIPTGMNSCERPPFGPSISAQPETTAADSPTGLQVNLHIPQNQIPDRLAAAHLKDTVVTLPTGMGVNPSAADGLGACSSAQIGFKGFNPQTRIDEYTAAPANCPANSKVGTVQIETPLLDHPLPGTVYLAKQGDNPFKSLLALYIAIDDPISGVVVKLAGRVEPDPVSGQLRTTFKDNPQLPFEDFHLDFAGGPRATLTTPPTCGKYTTATDLTPWSSPERADAFPSDSFQVSGSCAASEAQMPNHPSFEAGTANTQAASYSPFVLKLSRENGSQRLRALNVTLPPGLSGKLAGLKECSDAQIAVAAGRGNPGEGALEQASPSCPQASELGVVNVGAGSGSPLYIQGHAYLAGPYKGAQLSLAIITPAVAGPFDLGTVVVRSALRVNPETAAITVDSDPIPTILQGIPTDIRSLAVQVDRNQFTLNPTSCDPMSIGAQAISALGQSAGLSSRFQVGGCHGLAFAPKLAIRLKGGTKRGAYPALRAVFQAKQGEANTRKLQVALPHSEFLAQNHIRTICTRVRFAAHTCPKGSIYGRAKAFTPLLDKPVSGPVYLRSSSHPLPDLAIELNGQVNAVLVGRVDSVNGGIRNTFAAAPDVPVSKFILEMKGGKKSLLVNSRNICRSTNRATVKMEGHNGKVHDFNPALNVASCPKPGSP